MNTHWDSFLDRLCAGPKIGPDGTYTADIGATFKDMFISGTVVVQVKDDRVRSLIDFEPTETCLLSWGNDLRWGGWSDAVAAAFLASDKGLGFIDQEGFCFDLR